MPGDACGDCCTKVPQLVLQSFPQQSIQTGLAASGVLAHRTVEASLPGLFSTFS